MSDNNKPGPTELRELMTRVFASDSSEAFGQFMVRRVALSHMAPNADDALLDGVESALLAAVEAGRLSVDVTPEMVAVAAITELGD